MKRVVERRGFRGCGLNVKNNFHFLGEFGVL